MQKCATNINCSGNNYSLYSKDGDLKFERYNDCGLIWRTEDSLALQKDYEQEYFDSKKYEKRRAHKVKKSGWLIDLARLHNSKIISLLEVGCSIGYTLEAAKNRNLKHLGIDISKFAVDYCSKMGLTASNATIDELKSSGERFDLIFKQHVLEHFQDPFSILRDCHKLLNKNGLMVILVPNAKYRKAERLREKHRFYSLSGVGSEHYVYFNYTTLTKTLEACGFKVVQKNYPIFTGKYFSIDFFANRLFRRMLSFLKSDQELFLIAQKVE